MIALLDISFCRSEEFLWPLNLFLLYKVYSTFPLTQTALPKSQIQLFERSLNLILLITPVSDNVFCRNITIIRKLFFSENHMSIFFYQIILRIKNVSAFCIISLGFKLRNIFGSFCIFFILYFAQFAVSS